jgi:glycosyltransferase involved in cell wall biosynthesis
MIEDDNRPFQPPEVKESKKYSVSLIITTYNWKEALKLSIFSIYNQTIFPDEIIVADDGSSDGTMQMIEEFATYSSIPIVHSFQDDDGFRVSMSRNRAIAKAKGEYIILIDGDMILHPKFVQQHLDHAQKGYFIQGSRVLITEKKSKEVFAKEQLKFGFFESGIKNRKNSINSDFLCERFSKKENSHKGIRTCNMSFFKDDCIKVNGFNEDFVGWGREDSEFVERLYNIGINRNSIKFNCTAYHIYHNENSRKMLEENDKILDNTISKKLTRCENGIDKYLKDDS